MKYSAKKSPWIRLPLEFLPGKIVRFTRNNGIEKKIQSEKKLETNYLFSSNNLREESKLMNAPKSGKSLDTSPNPG